MSLESWLQTVARQAARKLTRGALVRGAGARAGRRHALQETYLAEALEPRVLLSITPAVFQAQQTFSTGINSQPGSVALADLNGDGRLDLVVANGMSSTVGVLLGNGNGTFQAEQTFSTGTNSGPLSVAVADLNGDGKPDIIVANVNTNTVGVFVGNGNGTFKTQQTYSTGAGSIPRYAAAADVNGDGKLDLIVADSGNASNNLGGVGVFLGNGNGTFQAQQTFATANGADSQPYFVAASDVNADGRVDIVVANFNTANVGVLLGNGNGTFLPQQTFSTGAGSLPIDVAVADVNGDGKPDICVAGLGTPDIGVLLANGNGTFQSQQTYAISNGANASSIAVADVNADGKPDLVIATANRNYVGVMLGNGNGTFGAQQTYSTGSNPYSVAVGDVNGDGRLDLVVANQGGNSVSVLPQDPAPFVESISCLNPIGPADSQTTVQYQVTFSQAVTGVNASDFTLALNGVTATTPVTVSGSGAVYTVTISNISGAGTLGLNLVNNGTIEDALNNPLGPGDNFFMQQTFATGPGSRPVSVVGADVNGDGKPDLVTANYGSSSIGVMLANGNGTFQTEQTLAIGSKPSAVAVADVNGDGKPDLISANYSSGTISVLLGNGNGTFQAQHTYSTGPSSGPRSIAVADLNGDGKLDLVVVGFNSSGPTIGVFLGNGDGTFQSMKTFTSIGGMDPVDVAVADLNGDGKPDLIIANVTTIGTMLGNGDGTFQSEQTQYVGNNSQIGSVAVADINGDGKPDIIFPDFNNGDVTVLEGGNPIPQTFATGTESGPTAVAVSDVNRDDKPDLIVADSFSGELGLFLGNGNGNGTFQPQQTFSTGPSFGLPAVAVSDLNGDHLPDLIEANELAGNVGVFLNDPTGNFTGQVYNVDIQADLAVAVSAPATINVDTPASYSYALTVTNQGPANNVGGFTITDVLPAAATFQSGASTPGAMVSGQTITYTGSSLSDGASQTYVISVTAPSMANGAMLQNSAAVATNGTPDPVSANNSVVTTTAVEFPVGYTTPQTYAIGNANSRVVAVADVNGDGIPDLIVTNQSSYSVGVLLGNGDGTFKPEQTFATSGVSSVAVADVNGDGKPDLIVANTAVDTVGVLLGNGDGTFQAQRTFATTGQPPAVAVADVNGDGKPDIVVVTFNDIAGVLLGNGDGTFAPERTFAAGFNSPTSIAVADVNGDGKPDLIVSTDANVAVLLGNGDGTFRAQQTFNTGTNAYTDFAAVADVNGDGKPDLVVANPHSNSIGVLLGNGNGTFQAQQTFSTGAGSDPVALAVLDLNGDGKPDVVVADVAGHGLSVLLGNGNGTFEPQQFFATGSASAPTSVAIADLNDDGTPDLVYANNGSATLGVFLGDPPPVVQSINRTTPVGPADSAASVTYTVTFSKPVTGVDPTDFSLALSGVTATTPVVVAGSGAVYTVTINGISGAGTLGLNLVNDGSIQDSLGNPLGPIGTFETQQIFATGSNPVSVAVADVNGDGIPDLVVANEMSASVSVLLGNGNGTFQAQQTFATGLNPFSVAASDVNGDGKPDLVVANFNSNSVSVLLGNGNGTFQAQQTFATGSDPRSVAVADVNGDGKPDLVVANSNSASVSVLLGNGNGTFQAQQTFATGATPRFVAVSDVNGDGKPDLVVANLYSASVSVLLGNGSGTFQAQQTFATGSHPYSVAVSDVNGDGKADLVVANEMSDSVSVLLGNGSGSFAAQQTFATGSTPVSVAVSDVNGDGKTDLVVANFNSSSVSVLLGNGSGSFAAQQTFATGTNPVSVAVSDVNGNGKVDLVVADATSNSVGMLLADPSGNFTGQVYTIAQAPTLTSSQVGDGSRQRSTISSITVVFSEPVNFSAASFSLAQSQNDSTFTDVSADVTASNPSSDGMTWVITCNAGSAIDRTGAGNKGFLANGIYQLTLLGSAITDAATGTADYNGGADQIVQFSYNNGASMKNAFAVLFGDVLGTGFVNNSDYLQFKATYGSNNLGTGTYNAALDFDGNGAINNTDYLKFKADYGSSLVFNTEPSDTIGAAVPQNQGIASPAIQSAAGLQSDEKKTSKKPAPLRPSILDETAKAATHRAHAVAPIRVHAGKERTTPLEKPDCY